MVFFGEIILKLNITLVSKRMENKVEHYHLSEEFCLICTCVHCSFAPWGFFFVLTWSGSQTLLGQNEQVKQTFPKFKGRWSNTPYVWLFSFMNLTHTVIIILIGMKRTAEKVTII